MRRAELIAITLLVDEYEPTTRFYCEHLGFEVWVDADYAGGQRNVQLELRRHPGVKLYIHRASTPLQLAAVGKQAGDGLAFLTLNTLNAEQDFARLSAAGVEILGEMMEMPWGRQFTVIDPCGNRITFFEDFLLDYDRSYYTA